MPAPQGPTSLTLSGIADGQNIDAVDVIVPFGETEDAIDEARQTVAVSDDDTAVKWLEDAIVAGDNIAVATLNDGGDEDVEISVSSGAATAGEVLTADGSGGATWEPLNVVVGAVWMWVTNTPPSKWYLMDGSLRSMTTFKLLLDVLLTDGSIIDLGRDAGTTVATTHSANLFTAAGHGLSNGTVVMFSNSGGALPAGLDAEQPYYVINATTNDFQVSLTPGGAAVDITSDGTGTHKFHIQFRMPDMRGRFPLGQDNMGGSSANRVTATQADMLLQGGGAESTTDVAAHTHPLPMGTDGTGAGYIDPSSSGPGTALSTNSGGSASVNIMNPYLTLNFIIYAGV